MIHLWVFLPHCCRRGRSLALPTIIAVECTNAIIGPNPRSTLPPGNRITYIDLVMVVEESCHRFRANEVRLQLNVRAYNLGNLWRRLVLPTRMDSWSLRQLVAHQCAAAPRQYRRTLGESRPLLLLLLAESHLTRRVFGSMLGRICALPVPTG
jgi:hypothetical protein